VLTRVIGFAAGDGREHEPTLQSGLYLRFYPT